MTTAKYSLRDSPFFRLRRRSKLAELIFVSESRLDWLANGADRYFSFKKLKKMGGFRNIDAPVEPLKRVQSRIAELLRRVTPPDYLFAPVKDRSYADNAAFHIGSRSVHLLDIESFFPNCTTNKVVWFFRNKLECDPDVAVILARIVTLNGSLPQGSPCSPILAYFAYMDMWDEVATAVDAGRSKLSVYADDLTISGDVVHGQLVWQVKKTIHRHGHLVARHKERSIRDGAAEVTGVILRQAGVSAPSRQHQKLLKVREAISSVKAPEQLAGLQRQFRGRSAQVKQIETAGLKRMSLAGSVESENT